jgi:hypothetical protein
MTILISLTGCNLISDPEQPVYIPAGAVAEVATLSRVECWITNKDTGKKERRVIEVQPGYYVGRPRIDEIGKAMDINSIPPIPDLPENQQPIK